MINIYERWYFRPKGVLKESHKSNFLINRLRILIKRPSGPEPGQLAVSEVNGLVPVNSRYNRLTAHTPKEANNGRPRNARTGISRLPHSGGAPIRADLTRRPTCFEAESKVRSRTCRHTRWPLPNWRQSYKVRRTRLGDDHPSAENQNAGVVWLVM